MNIIQLFIVISFIFANSSFAAMGGKTGMQSMPSQHPTMSRPHVTQPMSQNMMGAEPTRHMMTFMNQMQTSMQDMSKLMGKHQMMNQTQLGEAARVMGQMSKQMQEMSQQMQAGKFGEKELALMRKRHEEMTRNMNQLEKKLQNN